MVNLLIAVAFLVMCQQEVCTDLRFGYFKRMMVEEGADISWSVDNVSSKLKCTTLCIAKGKCATFGFDETKGSCQAFIPGERKAMDKHGVIAYYLKRRSANMHPLCDSDKNCYGIGSVCFKGGCMCDLDFAYNASEQACVRKRVGMYQPCANNDQCHINGSVCFEGTCMCTPGLSYHKTEQACVRKCSTYGKTMSIYKGLSIRGHNKRKIFPVSSNETCIKLCTNTNDFKCLSVDIKVTHHYCYLSTYGYLDVSESDRETGEENWMHATRDCAFR